MEKKEIYDQVTEMVQKQIMILSNSQSVKELCYNTALAAGFLRGLTLEGTITYADEKTYMSTIRKFAKKIEARLDDGKELSRDRYPNHGAVFYRILPEVRV